MGIQRFVADQRCPRMIRQTLLGTTVPSPFVPHEVGCRTEQPTCHAVVVSRWTLQGSDIRLLQRVGGEIGIIREPREVTNERVMMRSENLVEVDLTRWRRSLTPIGNTLQPATSSSLSITFFVTDF